jgi:hypothetical protein
MIFRGTALSDKSLGILKNIRFDFSRELLQRSSTRSSFFCNFCLTAKIMDSILNPLSISVMLLGGKQYEEQMETDDGYFAGAVFRQHDLRGAATIDRR